MNKNEDEERPEERHVFVGAVFHGFLRLTGDEVINRFKGQLELAGFVHREPRPQEREQHQNDGHHQDLHGDPVFPRMRWIGGRMADRSQESSRAAPPETG